MRKLVVFMHTSLDSFVAGPGGEMNWINVDDDMFEYAGRQTDASDTALYGRVTYQMMDAYWPTAGDPPDASKHDKQHSEWYNKVEKVILSTTLADNNKPANIIVINDHQKEEINKLKNKPGKNIVVFGSPSVCHFLMSEDLIDEYWLFVNPILLGNGIPMFKNIKIPATLKLAETIVFKSGVVCLHYEK